MRAIMWEEHDCVLESVSNDVPHESPVVRRGESRGFGSLD